MKEVDKKSSGNRVLGIHPPHPILTDRGTDSCGNAYTILYCIQECSEYYQICTTNISLSGPMQPSARLGEPRN